MNKIRILIVDDHGIVRAGLRSLLESDSDIEVVGEASNGNEAIDKTREFKPDVVLMDIAMPGMNGIEATRLLTSEFPGVRVIALTMHDDAEFLFSMLRAGASGYVLKETEPHELISAIRAVTQGLNYLSPPVTKAIVDNVVSSDSNQASEAFTTLTSREREVLRLAAAGRTNREIAEILFLSTRTVEKHRQSVMHKLGLTRRDELIKYAVRKGLIDLHNGAS